MLRRHRFAAVCALLAVSIVAVLLLTSSPRQNYSAARSPYATLAASDSTFDKPMRAPASPQYPSPERAGPLPYLRNRPLPGRPTATLFITSRPVGARVLMGGELVGVTPLVQPLPTGTYQFSLEKAGYVARDTTVVHSSRRRSHLMLALHHPAAASASQHVPPRRSGILPMAPIETIAQRHARLRRYIREAKVQPRAPAKDTSTQADEPPERSPRAGRDIVGGW